MRVHTLKGWGAFSCVCVYLNLWGSFTSQVHITIPGQPLDRDNTGGHLHHCCNQGNTYCCYMATISAFTQ